MSGPINYLTTHWFAALLLASALLSGVFLLRQRATAAAFWLVLTASALALAGIGGLAVPEDWGLWLSLGAAAALFILLLVVVLTGRWWAPLGYGVGGLLLLGLGGLGSDAVGQGLVEGTKVLASLEAIQPWWLLLLGLIPIIILLSYRSLSGLGPVRRWVAIGLRCAVILFLTLALAEVRIRHQNESVTVLFLIDRSLSIPEEYEADPKAPGKLIDRREERIERFVNDAVKRYLPGHPRDQAGVIVFGRRPHLELPPANVPQMKFKLRDIGSNVNGNYTDIAAAIKLALASFPEGTSKRIVLLSDGNENLGSAEEQARIARLNGVQIDVVPLAANLRNTSEVLVQSIEAPPHVEEGSQLPIRVLVRSHNPNPVLGTLTVKQLTDGEAVMVPGSPLHGVRLEKGLNPFTFKQPLTKQEKSYSYEATFQPEWVLTDAGEQRRVQPGEDRVQNNRATTHVVARGRGRVLLIEPKAGEHQFLVDQLQTAGSTKFKIHALAVERVPEDKGELGVFLSNYDSIILANIPADALSEEQQEMIRSNTYDQGCGLVMIGGPEGFGAGGWQNTAVERALPVDSDIKSVKVQGKGGLVLIMHASEMAQGNFWQKKIARLAIEKLSGNDEVGILHYDFPGGHKWHLPLQPIGRRKDSLLARVDQLQPGDMPDFDPSLQMAYDSLTEPKRELATKLVIIISDGDPAQSNKGLLNQMKKDKVQVSTVGVATHGAPQDLALKAIADATGGRFHPVKKAEDLPAIYIKETRLVSRSFVHDKPFTPRLVFRGGPTEKLTDALDPLYGFVRTTPKPSPLVEMPIVTPKFKDQEEFPILAYWHYGLGKSVAFTSDARRAWDRDWAKSRMYTKFWEQVLDWSLRPVESKHLTMTTEYRDGKVRVTVQARDDKNQPVTDLKLRGGITPPGGKPEDQPKVRLKFEQKNSGVYEAEVKAEEAGSYFINAQATRTTRVKGKDGKETEVEEGVDSVRAGVTIPYSPEFADLESNTALLERLRDMTGGQSYADDDAALAETVRDDELFRPGPTLSKSLQPIWYWLVFLAGVLLFFDVAIRRITVDALQVATTAERVWDRLRGRAVTTSQTPQFFDRLQSRKAQIGEAIDRSRAAQRFETGGATTTAAPPSAGDVAPPRSRPAPRPAPASRIGPEAEQGSGDAMSRLLKAKKRIQEERDKGKGPQES